MKERFIAIFEVNDQVYALFVGAFISTAIALYTNIFSQGRPSPYWPVLGLASALETVSTVLWLYLALELGAIRKKTSLAPVDEDKKRYFRNEVAKDETFVKLAAAFVGALISGAVGFIILPLFLR